MELCVGTAGWSIPKASSARFPGEGTHLARYARRLPAVEINTSFYRPHRPTTYARWAGETPDGFAFALKVPKEITHTNRLVDSDDVLDRFLAESAPLGPKRGPLLVQLPPSLAFEARSVGAFFRAFRARTDGPIACEPRHPSWFDPKPDAFLAEYRVARVAADPAVVPEAASPGGWDGLVYVRWHGSPVMYRSPYSAEALDAMAERLADRPASVPAWWIFDNTADGAATEDALAVLDLDRPQRPGPGRDHDADRKR